jgi:hypothetical protein
MNSLAQNTVVPIDNEPAPTLTVEAPLPCLLAKNVMYTLMSRNSIASRAAPSIG